MRLSVTSRFGLPTEYRTPAREKEVMNATQYPGYRLFFICELIIILFYQILNGCMSLCHCGTRTHEIQILYFYMEKLVFDRRLRDESKWL
jgi:hypothetical protein